MGTTVQQFDLRDFQVPLYDHDLERGAGLPTAAIDLASRLLDVDGFMIAAPEYNASIPGALKNLLDWTSRHRPRPFAGKRGMLLSASPSRTGGIAGLWALRNPLESSGAYRHPQMFSLGDATSAFSADGELLDPDRQERLTDMISSYVDVLTAVRRQQQCSAVAC